MFHVFTNNYQQLYQHNSSNLTNLTHSILVCSWSSQSWCWWWPSHWPAGGKPSGLPPHFLLAPHISGYAEVWVTGCGRSTEDRRRSTGVGGTAVTWNPGTCHVAGRVPQMSTVVRCVDLRNAVDLLETSTSAIGRDGHQRHQLVTSGPCSTPEKGWPLDLLLGLRTGVNTLNLNQKKLRKIGPQHCTTKDGYSML